MNEAKIETDIESYSLDIAREASSFTKIEFDSISELKISRKIWKNYAEKVDRQGSVGKTGVKHTILAFKNFIDGNAEEISEEIEAMSKDDEYIF